MASVGARHWRSLFMCSVSTHLQTMLGGQLTYSRIGDYSLSRAADGTECSSNILHGNAKCAGSSLNDTAPVCLQAMFNWMEYFSQIVQTMETKYTDYVAGDLNKIEDRYGPADVVSRDLVLDANLMTDTVYFSTLATHILSRELTTPFQADFRQLSPSSVAFLALAPRSSPCPQSEASVAVSLG